eukprot:15431172-Alexandrium_andersonii.AAC.1
MPSGRGDGVRRGLLLREALRGQQGADQQRGEGHLPEDDLLHGAQAPAIASPAHGVGSLGLICGGAGRLLP